ncbi:alpha-hydroxy acid oxidase [Herbiconiux sp. P18]|uniref:alpha-hydroxy acid oxidase n=1 Tax=Herbiconiux liangxiaofengii TaxID=3342795 RepID=UPI0035B8005E
MVQRRIPKVRDLAPLMRFKAPDLQAKRRRLNAALTIDDLRAIAKRRTPKAAFDYTEGAAEAEISLRRARQAFQDIQFNPAILRDVGAVTTGWDVLGAPVALPFGIAPTGFTRMMQTEGEIAGAGAAGAAGIPFSLSTMGTTAIEDVKKANPDGRNWFQLYMWKDRARSMALVERAAAAGFDTLLVTVDVPVAGARLRDKRNGFSIPPQLTVGTVLNAVPRPEWWINFLTTEPLSFASLDRWSGTVGELLDSMFDPSVTFDDLEWIKAQWPGKVVVKGVQSLDDARRLAELGVDGITLSNHGGRQLDRAPIPFHLLPDVAREFGSEYEVHLDTGIMSGADIVASVALGARFTLVGRAYLYGLMAGGREGVDRMIGILGEQITRTMRLLGVNSLEELNPGHVTQLERLAPRAVSAGAVAAASAAPARARAARGRGAGAATAGSPAPADAGVADAAAPKRPVRKAAAKPVTSSEAATGIDG